MKNFILILYLFIMTFSVYGASTSDEEYRIGTGSATDKLLKLGPSRWIRSNESSGKLEFSDNAGGLWRGANDHTLDSTDLLENKTLDDSNVIDSSRFGANTFSFGADVSNSGDRAISLDWHASHGSAYDFRIHRLGGVNGYVEFKQGGTGYSYFSNSTGVVMSYNQRGTLTINRVNENSPSGSGGRLHLDSALGGDYQAYIDTSTDGSSKSHIRMTNGSSIWEKLRLHDGFKEFWGAIYSYDTGGNGGNIPHSCSRILTEVTGTDEVITTCSADKILVGGGCYSSPNISIYYSYPPADNAWACKFSSSSSTIQSWAICCKY